MQTFYTPIISRDLAVNYIKKFNSFNQDALDYEANLHKSISSYIHYEICNQLDYLAKILDSTKQTYRMSGEKTYYEGISETIVADFSSAKDLLSIFKPSRDDTATITISSTNDVQKTLIEAEVGGTRYSVEISYLCGGKFKPLQTLTVIRDFVEFSGSKLSVLLPEIANFVWNLGFEVPKPDHGNLQDLSSIVTKSFLVKFDAEIMAWFTTSVEIFPKDGNELKQQAKNFLSELLIKDPVGTLKSHSREIFEFESIRFNQIFWSFIINLKSFLNLHKNGGK
jgi:hypothetical protein